jgi:hypothetical protein
MNATQQTSAWVRASGLLRRAATGVAGAARGVARVLAECHRAQRDLALLRLHPDRYDSNGDRAPDTYAEFLFRSPGTVWHEPSARQRPESTPRKPFGSAR